MKLRSKLPRPVPQQTVSGRGDDGLPAPRHHRGQKVEQALLGATRLAELIKKQNVHRTCKRAGTLLLRCYTPSPCWFVFSCNICRVMCKTNLFPLLSSIVCEAMPWNV